MTEDFFQLGYKVCTATHPDCPDFSGNARGRKLHLTSKDKKKRGRFLTLCGMLKDESQTEESIEYTVYNFYSRECVNCKNIAHKLIKV